MRKPAAEHIADARAAMRKGESAVAHVLWAARRTMDELKTREPRNPFNPATEPMLAAEWNWYVGVVNNRVVRPGVATSRPIASESPAMQELIGGGA